MLRASGETEPSPLGAEEVVGRDINPAHGWYPTVPERPVLIRGIETRLLALGVPPGVGVESRGHFQIGK